MGRNDDLSPRRTRRTVLFADIRGFTRWSENRPPEEVLSMLDGMFGEAEATCSDFNPVRTKHTGDEIMMFFTDPLSAGRAALALRDRIQPRLAPLGLGIGIGIHCGEVIEGLIGSTRTKAYDIIGDTVNTAKRVCDHAGPGKVVITFTVYEASGGKLGIAGDERIMAKGKSTAVLVAELVSVAPEEAQPAQG
jgi:class 3 adenylate cyclase